MEANILQRTESKLLVDAIERRYENQQHNDAS